MSLEGTDVFRRNGDDGWRASFRSTAHITYFSITHCSYLMLGSLFPRTVGLVVVVLLLSVVEMRRVAAFAPRLMMVGAPSQRTLAPSLFTTTARWMSNTEVTQERSEEEKEAIKAAREARK